MFPPGGYEYQKQPTDPEQTAEADAAALDDELGVDAFLYDKVLVHRATIFAKMGFNFCQSRALALDRRVDTHWVRDRLVNRGCPVDLAFDIAS